MDRVSQWICILAFLPSGFIYVYTIQRRIVNRKHIAIGLFLFFLLCAGMEKMTYGNPAGSGFFVRILGFLFLIWLLHTGIRLTWNAAIYYGVWAFLTWQILSEVWLILDRLSAPLRAGTSWPEWILGLLVYLIGYTLSALTIGRFMPDGGEKKIGPRQLSLALLDFVILQALAVMFETLEINLQDLGWLILYMAQLLLAVTLYLQNELFKKSDLRQEMEMMSLLRKKEQEQYRISKEAIALINQKTHDLKHQIQALRSMPKDKTAQYLDELEKSVSLYEAIIKTGCETLDIILTEKSLSCREQDIPFSCVADGSCLDFMDTVDLYTLLGNALDNAMEAVGKLTQAEKKQIDLLLYRRQKFLVIQVINPVEAPLAYKDGFPVTTKDDSTFHGFGLKSMEHTLKKYGGVLDTEEDDGCFSLTMLIPLEEKNTAI